MRRLSLAIAGRICARGDAMKVAPRDERPIWTDADCAEFFGIHRDTFRKRVLKPVTGEIDLNKAEPKTIGGRRFWVREKVLRLAGVK